MQTTPKEYMSVDEKFLGSHYPNATGHNDGKDKAMPPEGDLPSKLFFKIKLTDIYCRCQFVVENSNMVTQLRTTNWRLVLHPSVCAYFPSAAKFTFDPPFHSPAYSINGHDSSLQSHSFHYTRSAQMNLLALLPIRQNLAIKGIIGIKAMGEIWRLL